MIYLSFDIEEFDMPREYGYEIDFERQIQTSREGLQAILSLLEQYNIRATFFSTVVFAENCPDLIERLLANGNELASHTYYHSQFENAHLRASKEALEQRFSTTVEGLRMPRMAEVDNSQVKEAGYGYNSSVNPTFLPGRYNKLHVPKKVFFQQGLCQIPTAVSPLLRIPLFWLSFHNFPQGLYHFLLKRTIRYRGYATLYFHPWEFTNLDHKEFNFPHYVMRHTGEKMIQRFEKLLQYIRKNKWETGLYRELSAGLNKKE